MSTKVARLLGKGESEVLEMKGARSSIESVARSVCGMLNQQGGVVFWGVSETGEALGLSDAAKHVAQLNDALMTRIFPRPLLSVAIEREAGEDLVRVDIPAASDKPYSFEREIWVRVGSRTLRASESDAAGLVAAKSIRSERWEREQLPGFGLDACDQRELADARSEIVRVGRFGSEVPAAGEELLRRLYLLRNGQFTNACLVLFAEEPRAWAPNLGIRIVSFAGDRLGDIANEASIDGPAVRALREAVGRLQERVGFSARFQKRRLERDDRPAYSPFAIREALVNAVVHRDYDQVGSGIVVEIFPTRITIRNPGHLPAGWKAEDMSKRAESRQTNPDIARVFYLRQLMERLGLGAQRLVEECRKLEAPAPIWSIQPGSVSLTLFRAPEPQGLGEPPVRLAQFLASLEQGSIFKAIDYAASARISERQSRRDLQLAEDIGLVVRIGKGPATAYRNDSTG